MERSNYRRADSIAKAIDGALTRSYPVQWFIANSETELEGRAEHAIYEARRATEPAALEPPSEDDL